MARSKKEVAEAARALWSMLRGIYHSYREQGFMIAIFRSSDKEPFLAHFFPEGKQATVVSIDKQEHKTTITIHNGPGDNAKEVDRSLN